MTDTMLPCLKRAFVVSNGSNGYEYHNPETEAKIAFIVQSCQSWPLLPGEISDELVKEYDLKVD